MFNGNTPEIRYLLHVTCLISRLDTEYTHNHQGSWLRLAYIYHYMLATLWLKAKYTAALSNTASDLWSRCMDDWQRSCSQLQSGFNAWLCRPSLLGYLWSSYGYFPSTFWTCWLTSRTSQMTCSQYSHFYCNWANNTALEVIHKHAIKCQQATSEEKVLPRKIIDATHKYNSISSTNTFTILYKQHAIFKRAMNFWTSSVLFLTNDNISAHKII